MKKYLLIINVLLAVLFLLSCHAGTKAMENGGKSVNYNVHIFYYCWYGNPAYDGSYSHWNHPVIPHWVDSTWNHVAPHTGGDDIGANFYPQLGCYSSNDPKVIDLHMRQIRDAGIGVVAISWWGEGSFSVRSVDTYLDIADKYGLKIAFHIEPIYKTRDEFLNHLKYITAHYAQHPAFYKLHNKPFYYLYDSYKLNYRIWQSMLNPDSTATIRNTPLDGVFISLWTLRLDGEFTVKSGFDGFYTYFASDGFVHGCTTSNWPAMAAFAKEHNLIFVPCAGPGYLDTRIRPWNAKNTKGRENGQYYEQMFMKAVGVHPDFIGITSFNEWHEGTQIEPAVPKKIDGYRYEDYGKNTDPYFYLKKTKSLVNLFD